MKNFFDNEENQFSNGQESSESYEDLLTQELNGYFPGISDLDIEKYLEGLEELEPQQTEASSEKETEAEPELDFDEESEPEEDEEFEEEEFEDEE